jgi:hypothetical protein
MYCPGIGAKSGALMHSHTDVWPCIAGKVIELAYY